MVVLVSFAAIGSVKAAEGEPAWDKLASENYAERRLMQDEVNAWLSEDPERQINLYEIYREAYEPEKKLRLRRVLRDSFAMKKVGSLGIQYVIERRTLSDGTSVRGLKVIQTTDGGSANLGGIRKNDFIYQVGDWSLAEDEDTQAVRAMVEDLQVDSKVVIRLIRKSKNEGMRIRIMEDSEAAARTPEEVQEKFRQWLQELESECRAMKE
ncbi:MAG: hypothetical protein Q7Q71_14430 [Verrucomicrobiota bacterium JB023]|nr:hypothetical protein [Verrucomicrobiota bacterium JB023]